jgi:hypothetical protein
MVWQAMQPSELKSDAPDAAKTALALNIKAAATNKDAINFCIIKIFTPLKIKLILKQYHYYLYNINLYNIISLMSMVFTSGASGAELKLAPRSINIIFLLTFTVYKN